MDTTSCGRAYRRTGAVAVRDGIELPPRCDVFELRCVDGEAAEGLAARLSILGFIHDLAVCGACIVVESLGDPLMLFDVVDASANGVTRRAVLPLCDETLASIAASVWRDPSINASRILERAAGLEA